MSASVRYADQKSGTGIADEDVLRVEDVCTNFYTQLGVVRALNGVSFKVPRGKVLGIVGESGCGKSQTSLAVMQLVPRPGKVESGRIMFREFSSKPAVDLLTLERQGDEMRNIRGD